MRRDTTPAAWGHSPEHLRVRGWSRSPAVDLQCRPGSEATSYGRPYSQGKERLSGEKNARVYFFLMAVWGHCGWMTSSDPAKEQTYAGTQVRQEDPLASYSRACCRGGGGRRGSTTVARDGRVPAASGGDLEHAD